MKVFKIMSQYRIIRYLLVLIFCFSITDSICTTNTHVLYSTPNSQLEEQTLSDDIIVTAKKNYPSLGQSPFFNVKNLLNPRSINKSFQDPTLSNGKLRTTTTDDGQTITYTFFDRGTNKLVVIGTGFGNEKEKVAPFVEIFKDYDVVVFDYRGHGYRQPLFYENESSWPTQPSKQLRHVLDQIKPFINTQRVPHINMHETTFGQKEDRDVCAVIDAVKKTKHYTHVFGVGLCFSAYVFAKAAAQNPGLFDKLILDSALYSPKEVFDRIIASPQLLFDPQRATWNRMLQTQDTQIVELVEQPWFHELVTHFLQKLTAHITFDQTTTAHYLAQITETPILFFHGKKDKMTLYEHDFTQNITHMTGPYAGVLFADGTHLTNHLRHKELYTLICSWFLDKPFKQFLPKLKTHFSNKIGT